ncbi:MAG: hypothetical protein ACRERE_44515 [Candidatus Entotheonellia bacterium]
MSVRGLMGHVNENAVVRLGVMVERIASEAGRQGTAYAWGSGPDVCGRGRPWGAV